MSTRLLNASEAVLEGTRQLLSSSDDYFVIGEGVPDPKACFGTTRNLDVEFPGRVFDMPISENGGTGICIGAAISGLRPIMVHMRIDFLMYAMDQIVNNAAKWYSMYGGNGGTCPLVIRCFIGRGWGQGQQHSQNLEALFAHIPGLKVVLPSNAYNAKGLLIAAAKDNAPVIFIEHRWVHPIQSHVPLEMYSCPLGRARVAKRGDDITIVTWGYMVAETLKAAEFLEKEGISAEVLDLQTIRPIDYWAIEDSVKKTKNLLVVNDAWAACGVSAEIVALVIEDGIPLDHAPMRVTNPNVATPSTHGLTKSYYVGVDQIVKAAADCLERSINPLPAVHFQAARIHDVPHPSFTGPF